MIDSINNNILLYIRASVAETSQRCKTDLHDWSAGQTDLGDWGERREPHPPSPFPGEERKGDQIPGSEPSPLGGGVGEGFSPLVFIRLC